MLWLSLNPSKMIDRVGAILTPALLITTVALIIRAFTLYSDVEQVKSSTMETPFLAVFYMVTKPWMR